MRKKSSENVERKSVKTFVRSADRKRESTVEQYLHDEVKKLGGMCVKLDPNLYPGIPDRLVVLGGTFFIELKRPKGGRVSAKQKRCIKFLTGNGAQCHVICTKQEVDAFLNSNAS